MTSPLISRRDLDFLLFDLLEVETLTRRERFADHSRETMAAVLDTAYAIAEAEFLPHARKSDENEPKFVDGRVETIPEIKQALRHYIDAGFMSATADYDIGGLQLPFTVHQAANAVFGAANIATRSYPSLTMAAANVLRLFGTPEQKSLFMKPMREGRFFGTMALTEPQAGSGLADLRTMAKPGADGTWRLFGNKIFISGGDQDLTENIVHLVLARIQGAPDGIKGISLFAVPKFLVNPDGSLGARNDVVLAGLIHKMGWRGTTSTMLNFGEKDGAVGTLIGEPHKGLVYMFHMMNEARIGVGTGAAALGYTAYLRSLAYAKERVQGGRTIIGHADVRRMLLAQKAYVEGALSLCLYAATLVDLGETAELELLTPVVKSWPSQWCVEANWLAIQIHGGYGYTREYDVERIYRDNRLNPIHEGTHGIQGLDLLGRKVRTEGFALLMAKMRRFAELAAVLDRLERVTAILLAAEPERALANASIYLEAFGHVVIAWMWLRQAEIAKARLDEDRSFYEGKLFACRYFMDWELPKVERMFDRLEALDDTWLAVPAEAL